MTIRRSDLNAIAQTMHDLHCAVEAISNGILRPTDNLGELSQDIARRRRRAFASAAADLAKLLKKHNARFDPERFMEACAPKDGEV